MKQSIRFLFVFLLAGIPFLTYGIAIFLDIVKLSYLEIVSILFLGFPFWFLLVLPITLLFKLKDSTAILYLIIIITSLLISLYIFGSWSPNSHGITIGHKVFVENGVPTVLYYSEIIIQSGLVFITILLSSIFLLNY